MPTLLEELNDLHAGYVVAVNAAVEADDFTGAEELAAMYENEAILLMAEREGKTHLLPLRRQKSPDTALRRMIRQVMASRAA
jgi:hypothetical protein